MPYKNLEEKLEYNRKYNKEYYKRKTEYCKNKTKRNILKVQKRNRELINTIKNNPCSDCKQKFPPECMDFHHTSPNKYKNVAELTRQYSLQKIKEEIEKCILVCANCHRIRSVREQRGFESPA